MHGKLFWYSSFHTDNIRKCFMVMGHIAINEWWGIFVIEEEKKGSFLNFKTKIYMIWFGGGGRRLKRAFC